jgi:DNA-binding transcriptional LysR family regulator
MFDWNDLKYFLAVARNGSSLAAAKALRTSQSTVHRRLKELERRLGHSLIKRHPTGYRLTELGNAMLVHEEAVTSFARNLAASDQNPTGTVRVTCPEMFGYRLMRSDLLDKLAAQFPGLSVEFVMSDQVLNLSKGEADIAIRLPPFADDALVRRKIVDHPWAIYATHTYAERQGRIARFEDINDHSVIAFDGAMRNHHAARWLRTVAPKARVAA